MDFGGLKMKNIKKYFAVLLLAIFVVTLVGCDKKTGSFSETQESIEAKPLTYQRLQSVTIEDKRDGEIETFSVEWNGEECVFTDPDELELRAFLNPETNIFTFSFIDHDAGDIPVEAFPVHQYDEYGRIIKIFNEDDITEECIISYDENGWPTFEHPESTDEFFEYEYEFDAEKRQMTVATSGSYSRDENDNITEKKSYDVRTLDENGNIIHVDELKITTFNGEKVSEETIENIKEYTYDKNNNLICYETESKIMTFTYLDETIHHMWERNIAIYYTAWYNIYTLPLFWNIK